MQRCTYRSKAALEENTNSIVCAATCGNAVGSVVTGNNERQGDRMVRHTRHKMKFLVSIYLGSLILFLALEANDNRRLGI